MECPFAGLAISARRHDLPVTGSNKAYIMKKSALIGAAALSLATAPALAESRTYVFPPFDTIDIATGLTAVVTKGDTQSVRVEAADASMFERLDIKMRNGKLIAKQHTNLIDIILSGGILNMLGGKTDLTIYVTVSELAGIDASSGANIEADFLAGDHSHVHASSGASITISNVDARELNLASSSGADIAASGKCDQLEMHFSSGADIRAADLSCDAVDVSGSSGASADITATVSVDGIMSSGASVRIHGDPKKISVESSSGGSAYLK